MCSTPPAPRPKCLIQACLNPARFRGLCNSCHKQALRALAAGWATEAELVENGLLLPSVRGKHKHPSLWQQQFERTCRRSLHR